MTANKTSRYRVMTVLAADPDNGRFFNDNGQDDFIDAETEDQARAMALFDRGDDADTVLWSHLATLQ